MAGRRARALNLRVHRAVGIAAALLLLVLAVTGVLVNHGGILGLDTARVRESWARLLYARPERVRVTAFAVDGRHLLWANGALYLGEKRVAPADREPVGAVAAGPGLVVALPNTVLILTPGGRLADRMPGAADGAAIRAIAPRDGGAVVRTGDGCRRTGARLLSWKPAPCPDDAAWADPAGNVPAALRERVATAASTPEVAWSRLLLDLHSGRLFGTAGRLVVDLLGLAILALAVTGAVNWWAGRPRTRGRGRGR